MMTCRPSPNLGSKQLYDQPHLGLTPEAYQLGPTWHERLLTSDTRETPGCYGVGQGTTQELLPIADGLVYNLVYMPSL
jgi:hypothetical protein